MNETAANPPAPYSPTELAATQRAIVPPSKRPADMTSPNPAAEEFVHCATAEPQTLRVAQRLYPGNAGMIVLTVAPVRLKAELKHIPRHSGEIYPHSTST